MFEESDELDDDADWDSDYFDDGYDAPDTEVFDTDAFFVYCGDEDFDDWTLYLTIGDST